MPEIKILCSDEKLLPHYASKKAAALDLRASGEFTTNLDDTPLETQSEKFMLGPGERVLVKTGLRVALPKGCWGNIRGRSGIAMKNGISTLGGVIDEDYRGEIGVILQNTSKKPFAISKYDRVAQMIVEKYVQPTIKRVKELDSTDRGHNGFGSSGKH